MSSHPITTLFLDIGGVLLTNGWDTSLRRKTAAHFHLDFDEMEGRHHITYNTHEEGKMSFEEYLAQIIFYEPRSFTLAEVKKFIIDSAEPYPEMIDLIKKLRVVYGLKVAVVSNEGRELAEDRIHRFHLKEFVDFFIVSAFVHFRKPDADIYRLALDVAQVSPSEVAYLEDRPLLVEIAAKLGIQAVHHINVLQTREKLAALGLVL